MLENAYRKENQIKTIKYIDLENFHSNKKISKEKLKELYERNKKVFVKEFKSLQFSELTPQNLTGSKEYNEAFFKKLDDIENKVLDGQSFDESVKENSLKIVVINKINSKKEDQNNKKIENISDNFFKKIFLIKKEKTPEIIKVDNKYFLSEIKSIEIDNKPMNDPDVLEALNAQLSFQIKIENNTSILKDISMGGFDKEKFKTFAKKNNLKLVDYKISNLKQNEIFTEGIIKRIFLTENGEVDLITNSTLTKNYLILAVSTDYKKIDKSSNEFERYEAKARLDLVNRIYKIFDDQLNQKYKVELNQRTVERVKNSF